jgi:DUF917 family protein
MVDVERAVAGGAILAGGGGGWVEHGRRIGALAIDMGAPLLADIDEVPRDGVLVTASLVGANSSPNAFLEPIHYVRAVQLLQTQFDDMIVGFISSENGSSTTLNGWLQASFFGVPVVDAPCDGRAHPTGKMGSLGLGDDFRAIQAGVGGSPDDGTYVEAIGVGRLDTAANIIRAAAVQAGGVVAVARNPVPAATCRERAAVGAISFALELGRRVIEARGESGPQAVVGAAAAFLHGVVAGEGTVIEVHPQAKAGFDVGTVRIRSSEGDEIEISGYMEYVVTESAGRRLATFPDLTVVFDARTGEIISLAEIAEGRDVIVLTASREHLLLGAGVMVPRFYREIEEATGKEMVPHIFEQPGDSTAGTRSW